MRRGLFAICVASLCLGAVACFNGAGRVTSYTGGSNRLMLVIEPSRTDIAGTHFLIDTMNGDLWRLDTAASPASWVRSADGPDDLAELELPEVEDDVEEAGA